MKKSFDLLGYRYKVIYCKDCNETAREMGFGDEHTPEADGMLLYEARTVLIRTGLDKDYERRVFIHECLHAAFSIMGLCVSEGEVELMAFMFENIYDAWGKK